MKTYYYKITCSQHSYALSVMEVDGRDHSVYYKKTFTDQSSAIEFGDLLLRAIHINLPCSKGRMASLDTIYRGFNVEGIEE